MLQFCPLLQLLELILVSVSEDGGLLQSVAATAGGLSTECAAHRPLMLQLRGPPESSCKNLEST